MHFLCGTSRVEFKNTSLSLDVTYDYANSKSPTFDAEVTQNRRKLRHLSPSPLHHPHTSLKPSLSKINAIFLFNGRTAAANKN
jgi:hypothetical protein